MPNSLSSRPERAKRAQRRDLVLKKVHVPDVNFMNENRAVAEILATGHSSFGKQGFYN